MFDWMLSIAIVLLSWFGAGESVDYAPSAQNLTSGEVVKVIDGDTIDVRLGDEIERVRYIGMDSPEVYAGAEPECYSTEATKANQSLVEGRVVELESGREDRDKYDRLLRYVYVDDVFVNEVLLENGHADLMMIPPNTREYESFTKIRDQAKLEEIGLWGKCQI